MNRKPGSRCLKRGRPSSVFYESESTLLVGRRTFHTVTGDSVFVLVGFAGGSSRRSHSNSKVACRTADWAWLGDPPDKALPSVRQSRQSPHWMGIEVQPRLLLLAILIQAHLVLSRSSPRIPYPPTFPVLLARPCFRTRRICFLCLLPSSPTLYREYTGTEEAFLFPLTLGCTGQGSERTVTNRRILLFLSQVIVTSLRQGKTRGG